MAFGEVSSKSGVIVIKRRRSSFSPLVFTAAATLVAMGSLRGAAHADDAAEIRRTADGILSTPEFRHFARLEPLDGDGAAADGTSSSDLFPDRSGDDRGEGRRHGRSRRRATHSDATKPPAPHDPKSSPRDAESLSESDSFDAPSDGGLASAAGTVVHLLAWAILAAICAVIVYLVYQALRDFRRSAPRNPPEEAAAADLLETEQPPGETPADRFVTRAQELAAAGRYREAVAQLLLGAMGHIERAGLIRFRRGLTSRDYLRVVRDRPPQHDALRSLIAIYEPLGFGRRAATPEHFEASLTRYEAGFRGAS